MSDLRAMLKKWMREEMKEEAAPECAVGRVTVVTLVLDGDVTVSEEHSCTVVSGRLLFWRRDESNLNLLCGDEVISVKLSKGSRLLG